VYKIKISNPDHVSKGIKKLILNGKEISGNIIPIAAKGSENIVEAVMG
jgi:N,N'-diacetylchitobiose phosphorylase